MSLSMRLSARRSTPMRRSKSGAPIGLKMYPDPHNYSVMRRYSPGDWKMTNEVAYSASSEECGQASSLKADAMKLMKDIDQRTNSHQMANTKRLEDRARDVLTMRDELRSEIEAMQHEIAALQDMKHELETTIQESNRPLQVAEECLMLRESRVGIDQVHDDVEKSLIKEVSTAKRCQEEMNALNKKAEMQLKMNRATLHNLDKDRKDKSMALGVDEKMTTLRNSSDGLGFFPGIEHMDSTISTPASWLNYTQTNIDKSRHERARSENLRHQIEECIRSCTTRMWTAFNATNVAFQARVQEVGDAKHKMLAQQQRVMSQIFDMEQGIQLLKRSLHDKEAPLRVAMTRLEERTRRPNVEDCRDQPTLHLRQEVDDIKEAIRLLKDKLRESEEALARLQKTRSQLEHDINIKGDSFGIDQQRCLTLRRVFPMNMTGAAPTRMPIMA